METNVITIKRIFAASVEKVYEAWTEPAKLMQWFSPNIRWRTPKVDFELVAGGKHDITLRHSDGDEMRILGRYVEILPNERISFTWNFKGGDSEAEESLVTVEFRATTGGTELTLTHDRQNDPNEKAQAEQGWSGMMELLESFLTGTPLLKD